MFEIEALNSDSSNEGVWFTPIDPRTGEDLPMRIKLAGRHSEVFQRVSFEWANKRMHRAQSLTAEQMAAHAIKVAAACTLDWDGDAVTDKETGKVWPVTIAAQVYKKYPVLFEQVDAFINDSKNFLGVSTEVLEGK